MQRSPIVVARSLHDALSVAGGDGERVVVLPSSLERDDALAREVVALLRATTGRDATVAVPEGWGERLRGLRRDAPARWETVDVRAIEPSTELDRVVLPTSVAGAPAVIVACDLDLSRVAASGPYVLDVSASYVAPRTRLRLHASRGRLGIVAEIDLALRLRGAVVALTVGGERRYIGTADAIAGELVALALSERERAGERSVVGPWEDPIVQRATELRLGVLLPEAIDLLVAAGDDTAEEAIASHLALRLGVRRG